jgi:HEPN domain-containing protein
MERGGKLDVEKQLNYWREGARRALRSVPVLEEGEFWIEALFWTHLAVEKALKAHVVKRTRKAPPYIHKLTRLAQIAGVNLSAKQTEMCEDLSLYQRLARYHDEPAREPDGATARRLLHDGKELMTWLLKEL